VASVTINLDLPAHFLDLQRQREGFVLLAAFLISFLFIRTSARLMRSPKVTWWPGSVKTSSGLHLHHLVWGIVLLMAAGFLGFVAGAKSPWAEILAGLFGIGMGLTLDEFALWIHLRDVYWAEEGRASFDAVLTAAVIAGLIVCGVAPFDLKNNSSDIGTLIVAVIGALLLAAMAILKGRRLLGLAGMFLPFISLVGAARLASPDSPWARRFYKAKKLARAERRWARIRARRRRFAEAIAGAPDASVAIASDVGPKPPHSPD
jgi:hypothetical protein